ERLEVEDLVVHRVADEGPVPVSPQTVRGVQMAAQRELVGQLGGAGGTPERWVEWIRVELRRPGISPRESSQRPVLLGLALANHVELVVEDEQVLRRTVVGERLALVQCVAAHVEVAPEDL